MFAFGRLSILGKLFSKTHLISTRGILFGRRSLAEISLVVAGLFICEIVFRFYLFYLFIFFFVSGSCICNEELVAFIGGK